MTITTDYDLDQAVTGSAKRIVSDADNYDQALEWASEAAGRYREVMHYSKAHALIAGCNTEAGRLFAEDIYGKNHGVGHDDLARAIVFGEIQSRLWLEIHNLFTKHKLKERLRRYGVTG